MSVAAFADNDDPDDIRERIRALSDDDFRLLASWAESKAPLEVEDDWRKWLPITLPAVFAAEFAPHHAQFWDWVWSIRPDVKARPFVGCWPRGGAKSSSAEAACVALGARKRRTYGLYLCATQQQADDHVANVGSLLESRRISLAYPELSDRLVGKYGNSKGWRRNRLRTASGFTIDAIGLDTSSRGIKVDEDRPDFLVADDLDDEQDSPAATEKKIEELTRKILPAGSSDLVVLAIQNVVIKHGVFARLAGVAETPAEFLQDRIVSGPVPAVLGMTIDQRDGRHVIVAGTPSWEGQSLEVCQGQIDEWGITAFRLEAQHETDAIAGGMFADLVYRHCARAEVPDLLEVAVWCDPAVTATDNSDSQAVQCDGIADGVLYRLRSWEQRATPVTALKLAIVWAALEGASRGIGIETDQGGDTWNSVYKEARQSVMDDIEKVRVGDPVDGPPEYLSALVELDVDDIVLPPYRMPQQEKAGATQLSKAARAQQMLAAYERPGHIVHVIGTHLVLEQGLRRFGRVKPFDITDAAYWSWRDLDKFGRPAVASGRRAARRQLPAVRVGVR